MKEMFRSLTAAFCLCVACAGTDAQNKLKNPISAPPPKVMSLRLCDNPDLFSDMLQSVNPHLRAAVLGLQAETALQMLHCGATPKGAEHPSLRHDDFILEGEQRPDGQVCVTGEVAFDNDICQVRAQTASTLPEVPLRVIPPAPTVEKEKKKILDKWEKQEGTQADGSEVVCKEGDFALPCDPQKADDAKIGEAHKVIFLGEVREAMAAKCGTNIDGQPLGAINFKKLSHVKVEGTPLVICLDIPPLNIVCGGDRGKSTL